jgi:HK97 gp10 family phage protein
VRGIEIVLDTRGLQQLLGSMDDRAEKVLDVAARNIERGAKEFAPVDTGALKNSIHVEKPGPLERIVGDGVNYGIYQEYGTSRMPAQPWLTPAVEKERGQLEAAWKELLK